MSMQVRTDTSRIVDFDPSWIERIILELADAFKIRIVWNCETAILTGAFAIAGGLVGGYVGGRIGAAVGAGIGGITGLDFSILVSLREIWHIVKEKLQGLLYIVVNFLKRFDRRDYERAYDIFKACYSSRKELVLKIVDFLVHTLGREVLSSITAA